MDAKGESDPTSGKNRTTVERKSERELVVKRTFNAPARIVFEAWTRPELLRRWWAPKSFGVSFLSCEADAGLVVPRRILEAPVLIQSFVNHIPRENPARIMLHHSRNVIAEQLR